MKETFAFRLTSQDTICGKHLRTHFERPHRTPVALLIGLYEVFLSDFMKIGKVPEGVMTLRSAKDEWNVTTGSPWNSTDHGWSTFSGMTSLCWSYLVAALNCIVNVYWIVYKCTEDLLCKRFKLTLMMFFNKDIFYQAHECLISFEAINRAQDNIVPRHGILECWRHMLNT